MTLGSIESNKSFIVFSLVLFTSSINPRMWWVYLSIIAIPSSESAWCCERKKRDFVWDSEERKGSEGGGNQRRTYRITVLSLLTTSCCKDIRAVDLREHSVGLAGIDHEEKFMVSDRGDKEAASVAMDLRPVPPIHSLKSSPFLFPHLFNRVGFREFPKGKEEVVECSCQLSF